MHPLTELGDALLSWAEARLGCPGCQLPTSFPRKAGGGWSGSAFLTPPPGAARMVGGAELDLGPVFPQLGTHAGHSLAGAKQALGPSGLLLLDLVTSGHFTS